MHTAHSPKQAMQVTRIQSHWRVETEIDYDVTANWDIFWLAIQAQLGLIICGFIYNDSQGPDLYQLHGSRPYFLQIFPDGIQPKQQHIT